MGKISDHKQELREMSDEELLKRIEELNRQMFDKRSQHGAFRKGLSMEKPHIFKVDKKEIARIRTIINERKVY